jgi:hypothetical protein
MQSAPTYADQLLEGISNAIELEIWDVAESLARTLAVHIRDTGEYPEGLPREHLERLVGMYQSTYRHGPN